MLSRSGAGVCVGAVCVAVGMGAATASAVVVTTADPGGWVTEQSLGPSGGTPASPSVWYTVFNGDGIKTNVSGQAITFPLALSGPPETWRIGVTAMNYAPEGYTLPPGYTEFKVEVRVNGAMVGTLSIPASDVQWKTAWMSLGAVSQVGTTGKTPVSLTWTNDAFTPGSYDANIAIGRVQFAAVPGPGTATLIGAGVVVAGSRRRR